MRKIRIFKHILLDGVIEQDDGYAYGAWTKPYRTPTGLAMLVEAYGSDFDLLLGRHTYDLWSGFWPKAGSSPMADRLNAATKYLAHEQPQVTSFPFQIGSYQKCPYVRSGEKTPRHPPRAQVTGNGWSRLGEAVLHGGEFFTHCTVSALAARFVGIIERTIQVEIGIVAHFIP